MNGALDGKMKEQKEGNGRHLRIDCLMHSPYSLFISCSQPPPTPHPTLSCSLIHMQVSREQVRGEKKAIEKATAAASRER